MKRYKGFTASPGLVLGQVSRLERPPLVFGEGPFHPEQEKQALEDAIQLAQKELNDMADRAAPTEQAIFLFQSMMLEDEGFMNEVNFQILYAAAERGHPRRDPAHHQHPLPPPPQLAGPRPPGHHRVGPAYAH